MKEVPLIQENKIWRWQNFDVSWSRTGNSQSTYPPILLIHGFGACKEHWRYNQNILSQERLCYSIDLLGFGQSSKPNASLVNEIIEPGDFKYDFDSWSKQITDFCKEIINEPVILIGNSIGGVIALRTANILKESCKAVVLINCAQRTMDDKRLSEQPHWVRWTRPLLKSMVKQRWISSSLFKNAANREVIKKILTKAYPSGKNINNILVDIIYKPSQEPGASEAFRGFINLFDDHLATELLKDCTRPVYMIWGEKDPWEPIEEARKWVSLFSCIQSINTIPNAGHCPHDENPEAVNSILLKLIQQAT